ncbi:hypothetical protein ACHB0E_16470, partial [Acinetobacter baumannii]
NLAQLGALCISNLCATKPCHTINFEDNFVVLDAIRLTPKNN